MKRCKYPRKEKLSESEARRRAGIYSYRQKIPVTAYRCADHWHVGHPLKRNGTHRKRKQW